MPAQTFQNDADYQQWLADHPDGFVVNTRRGSSPNYMVLHRARCRHISDPMRETEPGGFTERHLIKVAADDIESLREWAMAHGRENGSFSNECGSCKPTGGCLTGTAPQLLDSPTGRVNVTQSALVDSPTIPLGSARGPQSIHDRRQEMEWQLWTAGPIERQVEGISPLLASWEKSSHPAQIRLRSYLEAVIPQLLPLPDDIPLFLHLDVDVGDSSRLLRHYDLENYLTPLFGSRWLPCARFSLVSARKYVGGGSRISWGVATPSVLSSENGWEHLSMNAGRGASLPAWKERIRGTLASSSPMPVPPGPARVRLAWRCAANRNWGTLWKPTGDAMGAVLGVADAQRPYHLDDDRIVDLEFHRNVDNNLGHDVVVGMWWRAA